MLTSEALDTPFGTLSPADPVQASLSQKELVIQLRRFAQDCRHQSALISNMECLKTLCEVLSTAIDSETCIIALQTLQFLAANPQYRETLKKVPKLMTRIQMLSKSKHSKISLLASNLNQLINNPLSSQSQLIKAKSQSQARSLHTIVLRIVNLNDLKDREDIAKTGIAVTHVISVSANVHTKQATFYCTKPPIEIKPKLIHALRGKGFQVIDESKGDKSSISMTQSPMRPSLTELPSRELHEITSGEDDVSADLKGEQHATYRTPRTMGATLGFAGDTAKLSSTASATAATDDTATGIALYKPTHEVKTLRERIEEEKKAQEQEKEEQEQAQSFLSTVVSYIW